MEPNNQLQRIQISSYTMYTEDLLYHKKIMDMLKTGSLSHCLYFNYYFLNLYINTSQKVFGGQIW